MVRSLVREGGEGGIGDCSLLILNPTAYVTKWIHCSAVASSMLTFQLPGHRTKEWILMYEKKSNFFLLLWYQADLNPLLEPHGSGKAPLHIQNNAVKFRRRYQSHFEAPGLHLFVGAAEHCSDDGDNSSNPTLHYTLHTKHRHTCANTPEQLGLCVPLITVFNTGVFTVLL